MTKSSWFNLRILLLTLVVWASNRSFSQDGIPDPAFGTEGEYQFAVADRSDYGTTLKRLADGSILTSGVYTTLSLPSVNQGYISKHLINGNRDLSFGLNGIVSIPSGTNGYSSVASMALHNDGKIVVSAKVNGSNSLMRLNSDGSIDEQFGVDGSIGTNTGGLVAIQSDGKIIQSGQFYDGYNNFYSFLGLTENGQTDITFGINGNAITDVTPFRFDLCHTIEIQSDGKILAAGTSYDHAAYRKAVLVRFNTDGSLDTSFGTDGVIIEDIGEAPGYGVYYDIEVQEDGKIVVGGIREYLNGGGGFGGSQSVVVRYLPDGTLDDSFGIGGMSLLNPVYGGNDNLDALTIQSDGKILVTGGSSYPFPFFMTHLNCTRLTNSGMIDTNFGVDGIYLSDMNGSETTTVYDIAIQADGAITLLGVTRNMTDSQFDIAIIRLANPSIAAIETVIDESEFQIYPNPASDVFTIDFNKELESASIRITNSLGQLIFENDHFSGSTFEYDLKDQVTGVYFIQIANTKELINLRLVKQ